MVRVNELHIQAISHHRMVQCGSVLSHDTLRHCLRSNNSLENGERELGHLFFCCKSCKNTFAILHEESPLFTTVFLLHTSSSGTQIVYRVNHILPLFAEVTLASKTRCTDGAHLKWSRLLEYILNPGKQELEVAQHIS